MDISQISQQFIEGFKNTSALEYVAVFAGIASVWYSRLENILVYPVGLISTIIYIYLSLKGQLIGEAAVNVYYTIMSFYGWYLWAKINKEKHHIVHINFSDKKWVVYQLMFFVIFYVVIFYALVYLKNNFAPGAIPWADAFASATAFTGMWLMTKKKVASWYWWIATNIASIPLYFVKHLVFTSVFFLILLIMAVFGLIEWKKKATLILQNNG